MVADAEQVEGTTQESRTRLSQQHVSAFDCRQEQHADAAAVNWVYASCMMPREISYSYT